MKTKSEVVQPVTPPEDSDTHLVQPGNSAPDDAQTEDEEPNDAQTEDEEPNNAQTIDSEPHVAQTEDSVPDDAQTEDSAPHKQQYVEFVIKTGLPLQHLESYTFTQKEWDGMKDYTKSIIDWVNANRGFFEDGKFILDLSIC